MSDKIVHRFRCRNCQATVNLYLDEGEGEYHCKECKHTYQISVVQRLLRAGRAGAEDKDALTGTSDKGQGL